MAITLTGSGITFSDSTTMTYDSPVFQASGSILNSSTIISNIPDSASVIFLRINDLRMADTPGNIKMTLGPSAETGYYKSFTTNITNGVSITGEGAVAYASSGTQKLYNILTSGTTSVNHYWYFEIKFYRTTIMSNAVDYVGTGGTYTYGTTTTPRTCWFSGHVPCRPMTSITISNESSSGMTGNWALLYA